MDEQERSFSELHASTEALLEAVLQFGAELVHAAPRVSESQNNASADTLNAPHDTLDESLNTYFAKSFDLRRRNAETQFSVAIIALAKSGAKLARAQTEPEYAADVWDTTIPCMLSHTSSTISPTSRFLSGHTTDHVQIIACNCHFRARKAGHARWSLPQQSSCP